MTDACGVCTAADAPHDTTLVEGGGGGLVRLCDRCVGWLIRRDRFAEEGQCAICLGAADDGRHIVTPDPSPCVTLDTEVCTECRRAIYQLRERARDRSPAEVGEA